MRARSAIFAGDKGPGFRLLLLCALGAIAAWGVGGASPVEAQTKTKINPKDGFTYVWISPGTFQMGCSSGDSQCQDDEGPARSVTISKGFWIGQTPVTQAAYKKVVGSNPSTFKGDQLPVETVSWVSANAYCESVNMRLPTEAEWEYAARGGSPAERYAPLDQVAWYTANSMGKTHEVAQKQANGYGLYDMLGNVWEWVSDWYGPSAGAVDPKGPPSGNARVLRGGAWLNAASAVVVSYRNAISPGFSQDSVGFRCAGE